MTALRTALREQATACADLGSPFTARLLTLTAEKLTPTGPVAMRLVTWPGDIGPTAQSIPLRLAGVLHRLVLSGRAPALAAAYPPHRVDDDSLWAAVEQALVNQSDLILRWLDSPPQTNEVRRAAALIAAGHWLTEQFGLPLVLSELGASAGLNLNWDHFALQGPGWVRGPGTAAVTLAPDWTGPPPPNAPPTILDRRGVDLRPFDLTSEGEHQRLLSYLWADQTDRVARTRAALSLPLAPVDQGDAIDWLAQRLTMAPEGALHLIYHTIAWQYVPADRQAQGEDALAQAGALATPTRPLARLGMEADDSTAPGAALTLQIWPGNHRIMLGRIDFHGRWVTWAAPPP